MIRTFELHRGDDVSGVSGVGHVADGAVFDDGTTVVHWLPGDVGVASTCVYASLQDAVRIHGHGGATQFVFGRPAQ